MFIDFLLDESVTVQPFLRMGDGEPVYGPAETRKARVELNPTLQMRQNGGTIDTVPAKGRMFTTGAPIPERSLVLYKGESYRVQACSVQRGFSQTHLEVTLE